MDHNSSSLPLISIINHKILESADLKYMLKEQAGVISAIAEEICATFRRENKIMLCGNGGSAADAQHIAAELAGKFYVDRKPLPAIALTTNTSVLTALANDYAYEEVFSRQVRALAKNGDMVIGISTSGNSANVISALEEAKKCGAMAVAFTGTGGRLKDIADICLTVSSEDTPRVQEAHITAGHIICYLVEKMLFGGLK